MVGSRGAAETVDGKGTALGRGSLRRFFCAGAALALLAGCSAAAPEAPRLAGAAPVTAEPAVARQPAPTPLDGLSAKELVALLGEPDFRRTEPPAELWQYRSAECVLDVFLYGDPAGEHVVHSETRDRSLIQAAAGRCAGGGAPFASRTRQSRL